MCVCGGGGGGGGVTPCRHLRLAILSDHDSRYFKDIFCEVPFLVDRLFSYLTV